jgi:PncC family amidohydrolase
MSSASLLPPDLLELGHDCGRLLVDRGETVAVGEGSCGGLVSAALLAVPGASAYYTGGGVIYTRNALEGLLTGRIERPAGLRGATQGWALHLARAAQAHLHATWGVGEGGAAGPSGNAYGDPPGHAWVAVAGPGEASRHVLTGSSDRLANMVAFASSALQLLASELRAASSAST